MGRGSICWVDLAADNAPRAREFYVRLFGWEAAEEAANGGVFTVLRHQGAAFGSLYQLQSAQITAGAPSHWTPYVEVYDLEAEIARAHALGAEVIVPPFTAGALARIALIQDPVGALIGLWEPLGSPD